MTRHSVLCGDFAHYQDPEEEWEVSGFASAEAAQEYARRFIRAQIEDLRRDAAGAVALRQTYLAWGEYAATEGFDSQAWVEHCIATPASRRSETDYAALDPGT
ncbi:MAG: hypothetical protein K2X74_23000 [Acetobacteraceae bacterium]|nr:hypothetical protein [Acetobacteraceae bacterium]